MALIKFKRGTRSQLDAAATASELNQGEPYYVTDEDVVAVGSAAGSAVDLAKASDLTTHADSTTAHGISTFGATLVDDADAASARTTLGLGTAATTAASAYEASGAVSTHASNTTAHGISPFGATLIDDADVAIARATLELKKQTGFDDETAGSVVLTDYNADSTFDRICKIAKIQPTLYLNFKEQDYRIYSPSTGLTRKALADIVTTTRAGNGAIWTANSKLAQITTDGERVTFDPATGVGEGLLVEESRQNLFLNSLANGTSLSTQTVTVTAAEHTISFYGSGSITLSGAHSATMTGTDDTTRTELTFTPSAGGLVCTVSGDVKWANCELGAFATSHIATSGTAATRAADVVKIDGTAFSDIFNPNESSVLVSWRQIVDAKNGASPVTLSDGTFDNLFRIFTNAGLNYYVSDSVIPILIETDYVGDGLVRVACFSRGNDVLSVSYNGANEQAVATSGSLEPDRLHIGAGYTSAGQMNVPMRLVCIFSKALSASIKQQLSALEV